jgi:lysophospholipase L1-like esterase
MPLSIQDGETILFIGDSITDCGRRGQNAPLGAGYVKFFADLATIREPDRAIRVINKGTGGQKIVELRDRWSDDVIRHRPDWLSVKIGINDLHSHLRGAPVAVPPDLYAEAYEEVLARTAEELPECRLMLVDPFYISTDPAPGTWRRTVLETLEDYIETVHSLSERYGTRRVRTHEMFQRLLEHHEPDTFCPEPVHPNLTGHMAIAEAVYAGLSD